ncbi:MAG: hypothetical protein GC149_10125 [Gammaproteobacteria bacterium]|nr:hypothetical protein [Gammaproteobacteria bacterium]
MWSKEAVSHKKKLLASLLKAPLEQLAAMATSCWDNAEILTQTLQSSLCKLPHCQLLYAIDTQGRQLCGNITRHGIDNTWRGQDLSARPYLQGILPFKGMTLSAAYLSQRSMQPCITALQAVRLEDRLLGFIAADFHIKDLPNMSGTPLQRMQVLRSDAARTAGSTKPARQHSEVDANIDYLIYVLSTLMQEHGIFQSALHFNSAYASLWSVDDPLVYTVHKVEELLNPELFLRYPKRSYDRHTQLELDRIPLVFAQLKALRQTDDSVYLRSGSVNIMNGLIGLTFSGSGSYYMNVEEFLNHNLTDWLNHDAITENPASITTPN